MRGERPRAAAALIVSALVLGGAGYRNDSGHYPDARPPAVFSSTVGALWHVPLPEGSNASPLVIGDRVCVMIEPTTLSCREAATGRELWRATNDVVDTMSGDARVAMVAHVEEVARLDTLSRTLMSEQSRLRREQRTSDDPTIAKRLGDLSSQLVAIEQIRTVYAPYLTPPNRESVGYTMPTPWTDGRSIWVQVGNGVVSRFGTDGRRTWSRWLGTATADFRGWTFDGPTSTASPRLVDGVLVVAHGALFGLDPATGDVRWKVDRYADFGSPAVARVGADAVLITPDGRAVRARDGKLLAQQLGSTFYAGPHADGDRVWFAGGGALDSPGGFSATAVRLAADGPDRVRAEPLWRTTLPARLRVFASPVVSDGKLWVVQESGALTVLDADTGAVVATTTLGGAASSGFYSSAVAAGGSVWFGRDAGDLYAVRSGASGALVVDTHHLEPLRSSPVFAGSRVYVRTLHGLWAF